jgi:hypothetical protein
MRILCGFYADFMPLPCDIIKIEKLSVRCMISCHSIESIPKMGKKHKSKTWENQQIQQNKENETIGSLENSYKFKYVGYEKAEQVFNKHHGLKFYIAKELKIDRVTLDDWLKNDEKLNDLYKSSLENTNDYVFSKTFELIEGVTIQEMDKSGEVNVYTKAPDPKAIQIYFTTKGMMVNRNLNDNKNDNFNKNVALDLSDLSDQELQEKINALKNRK